MTKEEFIDWKTSPHTKQIFTLIQERIYTFQVELGISAGLDLRTDAMNVGAIRALSDILEIEFEESQE